MPKEIKLAKEAQDNMKTDLEKNAGQRKLSEEKMHCRPKGGPANIVKQYHGRSSAVAWQKY